MTDVKSIGITVLILSGLISAAMVGNNFFKGDTPYICEARLEIGVKYCNSLTKYGVENGKCTVGATGFICKTGWVKVYDDRPPQPATAHQYKCNQVECIAID